MLLGWEDGRYATLQTSFHSPLPGQARVFGTTGWIDVLPRFHHPTTIVLHHDRAPSRERIERPPPARATATSWSRSPSACAPGATESTVMPLDDTLAVQGVLAEAGDQLGLVFREDDTAV